MDYKEKEELLGGLIALICIALVAWIIYACAEADKRDEMLLKKYPECVMAGRPYTCARLKEELGE